jgi:hypothetical protein
LGFKPLLAQFRCASLRSPRVIVEDLQCLGLKSKWRLVCMVSCSTESTTRKPVAQDSLPPFAVTFGLCCSWLVCELPPRRPLFEHARENAFALGLREPLDGVAQRRSWHGCIILL